MITLAIIYMVILFIVELIWPRRAGHWGVKNSWDTKQELEKYKAEIMRRHETNERRVENR